MSEIKLLDIYKECVDSVEKLLGCFTLLHEYKTTFIQIFRNNENIITNVRIVLRDIEPLQSIYRKINEMIVQQTNDNNLSFPELFLDNDVNYMLIFHRSFLSQFDDNMKWIQKTKQNNKRFSKQCQIYKRNPGSIDYMNFEMTYEHVFKYIFQIKALFDKYMECCPHDHPSFTVGQEAQHLIISIIQKSFNSQYQKSDVQLRNSVRRKSRKSMLLTDSDYITYECFHLFKTMLQCLSYLQTFNNKIDIEFNKDKETRQKLENIIIDSECLQMMQTIIDRKVNEFKDGSHLSLSNIFMENDVKMLVTYCKPFVMPYENNSEFIQQLNENQITFQEMPKQLLPNNNTDEIINIDECFYSIFNILFSFELLMDRYSTCFSKSHLESQKAERVKRIITKLRQHSINSHFQVYHRSR